MEANLQNIKLELIQWLATLEDNSILQKILDLRNDQARDWWNEISEEEKASIEKGMNDANKGNIKPHSEAYKIYEKYL